ncbi:MAG: diguanylate cyclase, partial [gamma proteobacterium symbiont of Bathyaustriella thionipta]|nr:diguanylate cyclase [gamma proteobacterium symbiont of Bathyaustriella thionipta]
MNHVASHPEGALNLLIIEKSPNTAERLANVLRNAGVAVHMVQAINEAECREAWQAEAPDIILFAHPHSKLDFSRLMQLHDQQSSDAPVIVISNDPQLPELISALEEGAHDVVYSENNQHLALAVARSQESLYLHRQLARTHDKLAEAEDRCNSLIDSSRDAIAFAHEGMHMYANRVYLEMFGFVDQEDIEGLPLLDMIAPERHAEIKKFLRTFGNSDDKYAELETVCLGSDGKPFDAKLEFSPVSYDGEACTQLLIRDQSQSKDLEQKLQEISNIDVETGLFNRQYLSQQMETGLENGNYKTLLYINLENYEEIRASAGLSACDKIMKELADITQSSCADDSLGGRFNEHTIAILSRSDNSENIEAAAARFCETVESHSFDSVEQLVNPVCRIGIAYSSQAKHDAQDLVHQAYQACELASEQQSCFASYDPSHDLPSASDAKGEDSDVVKLIDYALEHDHFRLVFQPIVSLQGDSRENYAVLLRLLDANNEEMRPADFFPQAEAAGLMAKIDRWVIRNAIKELSKQRAQGRKTKFFNSLTGATLEED